MFQSKRHGLELILTQPNSLLQTLRDHFYDLSNTPSLPTPCMQASYIFKLTYYNFLIIYDGSSGQFILELSNMLSESNDGFAVFGKSLSFCL